MEAVITIVSLLIVTASSMKTIGSYMASLSQISTLRDSLIQEMTVLGHVLSRAQQTFLENQALVTEQPSSVVLGTLAKNLRGAISTCSELDRALGRLNQGDNLSHLDRIKWIASQEALLGISARLKEHRSLLTTILTFLPRPLPNKHEQNTGNQSQTTMPTPSQEFSDFPTACMSHYLKTSFSPNSTSVVHTASASASAVEWNDIRKIGSGANGTTVTLQSGPSGLLRAVKRVLGPASAYVKEIDALSRVLDCKQLFVQFLGWYTSNDFLYIAMEFIENGDLSALINSYRTSPFPEEICREITRQVLEGVKVLHERHICHRDLKPQNILVARIDPIHVKIADFGSSKHLEGTQFRTRVGTPGYIAPELLGAWEQSDRGNMLGYSVDMWAVGCITHELLLSKRPFETAEEGGPTWGEPISGVSLGLPRLTDMLSLIHFCNGDSSHLVESLRISGITAEAGEVVEGLLRANPSLRLSASQALNLRWMSGAGRARHARSTATRNF